MSKAKEQQQEISEAMTPSEVAKFGKVSELTLAAWRSDRKKRARVKLPFHKSPGTNVVRYRRSDVVEFFLGKK